MQQKFAFVKIKFFVLQSSKFFLLSLRKPFSNVPRLSLPTENIFGKQDSSELDFHDAISSRWKRIKLEKQFKEISILLQGKNFH